MWNGNVRGCFFFRAKARKKLDKELLEAKGEESKQIRLRFAADSTNLLFAIYFRILKTMTSPDGEADKFTGKHFRLILRFDHQRILLFISKENENSQRLGHSHVTPHWILLTDL